VAVLVVPEVDEDVLVGPAVDARLMVDARGSCSGRWADSSIVCLLHSGHGGSGI
jgi:hypothetical protein